MSREEAVLLYLTKMAARDDLSNLAKVALVSVLALGGSIDGADGTVEIVEKDLIRCVNLLLAIFQHSAKDPLKRESVYPLMTPGDA